MESLRVKPLRQHHFLKKNDGTHGVVKRQLVLVELGQDGANVQMCVGLNLRALKARLNGERALQEVKSGAHFADTAIVASHIVKGHGLAELVVLAQFLALLKQVKRAVDVLLLKVVDSEDVADLAQLLASTSELFRSRTEMHFLDFEELLKDADCLHILALLLVVASTLLQSSKLLHELVVAICLHRGLLFNHVFLRYFLSDYAQMRFIVKQKG